MPQEFADVHVRAESDPNVLGLVLAGSRGAERFVTERSDHDVYVILRSADPSWAFRHGDPVETVPMTVDEFDAHGLRGSGSEWNRPTFLRCRVLIDKLDGQIARAIERKRRLTAEEVASVVPEAVGDYVNSVYRSLRNLEAGRDLEGRLDAAESVPPLLTTVFALDGRVRPFNKWLRVELDEEPLRFGEILQPIERIIATGEPETQRAVFQRVEERARSSGFGGVVDGWEPNVGWLRGR